jgi:predicted  nucleic acid-binding Zn-ribbon protein
MNISSNGFIHPIKSELDDMRRSLTKLEFALEYYPEQNRLNENEVSAIITRMACLQEQIERKICDEIASYSGTESFD